MTLRFASHQNPAADLGAGRRVFFQPEAVQELVDDEYLAGLRASI